MAINKIKSVSRSGSKTAKKRKSVSKSSSKTTKKRKSDISSKYTNGSKTAKKIKLKKEEIEWRLIPGWTKYEASSDGRIRNVYSERVMEPSINGGYYTVTLSGDGEEKNYGVHILVGKAFHPNPNKLPEVDHINNKKLDNRAVNLRWITYSGNSQSYCDNFRKYRAILQYDKEGNLIKKWKSMKELLKKNPDYRKGAIYHYLKGNSTNAYGYLWEADPPISDKIKPNPNEKFKPIGVYKNKYDLSKYGVSKGGNVINIEKNYLMAKKIKKNGYEVVGLTYEDKTINFRIHILVANIYIPNDDPINKIQVNHIDKNRSNNYYKNLEWVTVQQNGAHATGKMVKMIDNNTDKILNVFRTVRDAFRYLEVQSSGHIAEVCNGNAKTYKGYKWEWVKKNEKIDMPIITVPIQKKINKNEVIEV